MTAEQLKQYAHSLGYEFSDDDCAEIINTTYDGETVEQAVRDFIDAYEGGTT